MKITKRKEGEWVIDFTLNRKRIRRVIKGTRRMAEQAATLEMERIYKQKYRIPEPKKKIRFEDYVKEYEENYMNKLKSAKSRKYIIQTLTAHFKGNFLSEITKGEIDRYQTKRKKEGVSDATIKLELSLLRAMLIEPLIRKIMRLKRILLRNLLRNSPKLRTEGREFFPLQRKRGYSKPLIILGADTFPCFF